MNIGISIGIGKGGARRGGPPAWTPATLFASGEQGVWLDPSDLSTMFTDVEGTINVTADGQQIAYMLDKSGRGNHVTQSTLSFRPRYKTDGTKHWLLFDGLDDYFVSPTITPDTDKVQVFSGVRKLASASFGMIAESASSDGFSGKFYFAAPTSGRYEFSSKGTTQVFASATGTTPPITNIISGAGSIAGDSATLRVDGVQVAQVATDQGSGNYLSYPLYIGRRGGASLPFNGHMYGIFVRFGPSLDADAIAASEAYLTSKTV